MFLDLSRERELYGSNPCDGAALGVCAPRPGKVLKKPSHSAVQIEGMDGEFGVCRLEGW